MLTLLAGPVMAQDSSGRATLAPVEMERLLETLKDDGKRQAFVGVLETLVAAQKLRDAEAEKSMGTRFLEMISGKMDVAGSELASLAKKLGDAPALFTSARAYFTNPGSRTALLWLFGQLALILVAGVAAEWLTKRLLQRFHLSIEAQVSDGFGLRLFFAVLRTFLDLIAVAAFITAAYATMTLLTPAYGGRVVALALINANVLARIVLAIGKMFLAPHVSAMRLLPIADEVANYIFLWIVRLVYVLAYGYFLTEVMPVLGASEIVHGLAAKLVGLVVALMLIVLVLQNRQDIADKVRGNATRVIGQFRRRVADLWHLVAILYVIAIYGVWALEVPGGFDFVVKSTGLSLLIIGVSHALVLLLRNVLRKVFSISEEQKSRFPGLEARAGRYLPVLSGGAQFVLYGAAAIACLRVWGLDALGWISTPAGVAITKGVANIVVISLIALLVWELISAGIERYLAARDNDVADVAGGQRALTLLPLLRNVVMIALAVLVALTILSEIGVNIGPLIAGAGIFGLAIGFGAQTFVKDVITGFFILIEDSVGVGDLVVLGGYKGKVEAISIRSIQLRDLQGDVHRIPFSEVTSTTNRSKVFSFAFFDIGVAYREDVDHCMNVIREVGAEMREDQNFGSMIMEDIEVMGVQSFDDSAVIIRARFKVAPGKQLSIQRAFNRLIKNRFDAEGIEIPFPHRTIYFGADSQGNAPSAHVQFHETSTSPERRPKATLVKAPEGERADFDEDPGPEKRE
ncbi:MAG: mechanosensitive ion channel [Proteobacteria bacterium]|nr:mechanosensitive ion channel [Pseudomonadota bacterium]